MKDLELLKKTLNDLHQETRSTGGHIHSIQKHIERIIRIMRDDKLSLLLQHTYKTINMQLGNLEEINDLIGAKYLKKRANKPRI
jgi:hypothetical protein